MDDFKGWLIERFMIERKCFDRSGVYTDIVNEVMVKVRK